MHDYAIFFDQAHILENSFVVSSFIYVMVIYYQKNA